MALRAKLVKKIGAWLSKEREPDEIPMCDFEKIRYEIRPCDIILVEGRSRISDVIRMVTQSTWSHTALYIGRLHDIENPILRQRVKDYSNFADDEQLIIEGMLGQGTIVAPLSKYKRDHIRLCRASGISREDALKVIGYAIGRLGLDYDVRHILDLYRFLLPWGIFPRRWRSSLFEHKPGSTTKEICSTMIAEAFGSVKYPILPLIRIDGDEGVRFTQRNPKLFTPRDFDYSPYFDIIKYPIFQLSGQALYRHLPWAEDGISSIDKDTIQSATSEAIAKHIQGDNSCMSNEHAKDDVQQASGSSDKDVEQVDKDQPSNKDDIQ